jgi:predicted dehydrogenase
MTHATQQLRWGLVSTANINRALINPIRRAERSALAGVASRSLEKAQAYADQWSIPKAYGSYEAMLADPEIDVVYVSLPNALHAEWTVKAADAGKHVLCEKPIVPTLPELDQIEAAAARNGVTIFEAFMYLHHPQTLTAQRMIAEGRIGKLQLIRSWFSFYLSPEQSDNIRLNTDLAGGAHWDVGVYPNSMAITMVGGPPTDVWAQQTVGETGVDVTMIGQLRFDGGASAQIASSFRMPFTEGTVLIGDEGTLTFTHPWKPGMDDAPEALLYAPRGSDAETIAIEGVDPYLCQVRAMEACVFDGAAPVVPLSRSRDFLRSTLALYESARTGRVAAL